MPNSALTNLLALLTLVGAIASTPALAQSIVPEAIAPGSGTGTVVTPNLTPNGNQLDISGGRLSDDGINLFHGFTEFGLDAGEIANFQSNPAIRNILARISGGNASYINGLIQVSGSNANLFLLNPAGIVFGSEARLNVPGSFAATTATGIGFGNNWFEAVGENQYAALVGEPTAFDFSLANPGAIVNLGNLAVGEGNNLTLLGGMVLSDRSLSAPGGNITIAAISGERRIRISQPGHLLSLDVETSSSDARDTSIDRNSDAIDLDVTNPASIRETRETISPLSLPELLTGGNGGNATGVQINNDGTVELTGSGVRVSSGDVVISGSVDTSSLAGAAGNISLAARNNIIAGDLKAVSASGTSFGIGGNIDVNARSNILAGNMVGREIVVKSLGEILLGRGFGNDTSATSLETIGGGITLHGASDITVGNVTANGGEIEILSSGGAIDTTAGALQTNGDSIFLHAAGSINTGAIAANGGEIEILNESNSPPRLPVLPAIINALMLVLPTVTPPIEESSTEPAPTFPPPEPLEPVPVLGSEVLADITPNQEADSVAKVGQGGVAFNKECWMEVQQGSILGDYRKAIGCFQENLAVAQKANNREWQAKILNNLGVAYFQVGDYAKALASHQEQLAIAEQQQDSLAEGQALVALATVYSGLGNQERAIEYYDRSLEIVDRVREPEWRGTALRNLGIAYIALEDYEQAIEYQKQSLYLAQIARDKRGEGQALGNLGIAYFSQGDYRRAIQHHNLHLETMRELGDRRGEGEALGNLGLAYFALKDYEEAIAYHQQHLAIARDMGDRVALAHAFNNLGLALYKQDQFADAIARFREGIQILESIRAGLGDDDLNKVSLFDTQTFIYQNLQEVLVADNKTESALEIAERGRARAFVELLASDRRLRQGASVDIAASVEPPDIEKIKQIAAAQNATLVQYSIIKQPFDRDGKRQILESEIYIWVVQPTGQVTFRSVDIFDIDPLWQQQENYIELAVSQARCFDPLCRHRLRRQSRPQPKAKDLSYTNESSQSELVSKFDATRPYTRHPTPYTPKPTPQNLHPTPLTPHTLPHAQFPIPNRVLFPGLQQFYNLLIEPIAGLLPADPNQRVIFIPQEELFMVPFPALQDADGRYLIEKHAIVTAPSIQVLELTRRQGQRLGNQWQEDRSASSILLVGNPTMPEVPFEGSEKPVYLASLPGAEREATEIAAVLGERYGNIPAVLTGDRATEAYIVEQLPEARLVHLATHGLLDDLQGQGLPGAVALAPSPGYDGLLTSGEIAELKLNAELVVLSACDTGRGRITGDGVIGLSRSFLSAGVKSAIVSLWAVPDAPTAFLMSEFYRQWQIVPDKAKALRLAAIATMQHYPNPRDWAAFTLIGEAE
ncbi:MAG: CHAT domain-containing protein [Oscillatoria sp. SIO1A7]|nr:CHAT domain-containing protein [Oscillatoria sp. SIO1A7]